MNLQCRKHAICSSWKHACDCATNFLKPSYASRFQNRYCLVLTSIVVNVTAVVDYQHVCWATTIIMTSRQQATFVTETFYPKYQTHAHCFRLIRLSFTSTKHWWTNSWPTTRAGNHKLASDEYLPVRSWVYNNTGKHINFTVSQEFLLQGLVRRLVAMHGTVAGS